MLLPQAYLGNVITLCVEKRGVQTNMVYHGNQVALTYEDPDGGSGARLLRSPEIYPRVVMRLWTTTSNASRRPTWYV